MWLSLHLRQLTAGLSLALSLVIVSNTQQVLNAQEKARIGPFVIELSGVLVKNGQNEQVASDRSLNPKELPSLGLGVSAGAHWYPLKIKKFTLGLGGQFLRSSGSSTPMPDLSATVVNELWTPTPEPSIKTRFQAISPQVSVNFGGTSGWSYISGGMGKAKYSVTKEIDSRWEEEEPDIDGRWLNMINYGGGGRWFAKEHLGFNIDLRFYQISPLAANDNFLGLPRQTVVIFSVGVLFR